jgi:hypothetical protein
MGFHLMTSDANCADIWLCRLSQRCRRLLSTTDTSGMCIPHSAARPLTRPPPPPSSHQLPSRSNTKRCRLGATSAAVEEHFAACMHSFLHAQALSAGIYSPSCAASPRCPLLPLATSRLVAMPLHLKAWWENLFFN